jgi:DNA polymerase I
VRIGPIEFREVWLVDFEFFAPPGERSVPVCLVAREIVTGREVSLWQDELQRHQAPPYETGPDALFVAYYASAEIGCHLALGWPVPTYVLDLFVEFRNLTNGNVVPCGNGLLGALAAFGLNCLEGAEKERMRDLVLSGGPWSDTERDAILAYCASDVSALEQLLSRMLPDLDLPRAVYRGRYMKATASIEHTGVPIDVAALTRLRKRWPDLKDQLINEIDADYGVFEGRTFKADRWARWLAAHGIAWPRLPSGALALDDETFRQMARVHPAVAPMRELRASFAQMRLEDLAVGSDGRNRCLLSAFRARTGRNQPSNMRFIFGPAVWLRSLIRPERGWGLAYIDWSQQEFGIAAALSGDVAMRAAYESGDPYLAFARQAGAISGSSASPTQGAIREQFKACALAVQYGMGADSLAHRIGQAPVVARELLRLHQQTYTDFWRWSDDVVQYAMLNGQLHTAFGWNIHCGPTTNARSLRNFPMQANGAEMLRLACCLATEGGIRVCAPVHDALLIEAPLDDLSAAVATTQQAMAEASSIVLGGFRLRSEAELIRYPDRYQDGRGIHMWNTAWRILDSLADA